MQRLPSAVDWFVPPRLDSLEKRGEARAFVVSCFGMTLLIALGLVGHYSLAHNPPPIRIVLFMCSAFAALPFALRATGRLRLAQWLFTTNVAIAPIAGAIETGLGVHAPIMVVTAISPILACAFLGRIGAIVFSGVGVTSIAAAYGFMPDAATRLAEYPGTSSSTSLALALLTFAGGGLCSMLDAERTRLTEQMLEGEAQLRLLAEDAVDVVFRLRLSPQLVLEYANPAFERLVGMSLADSGPEIVSLVSRLIPEADRTTLASLDPGRGSTIVQFRIHAVDGTLRWLEAHCSFKKDRDGSTVVTGICRDVTARKQSESTLAYQAQHDALTGLRNRRAFDELLGQALRERQGAFALLFIDLDRFKPVNDALGHDVGDDVLRAVAKRLERAVRELDVVCRIGGDEFAVILHDADTPERAHLVAKRVVEALDAPFHLRGHKVSIGASVGVASCPEDGTSADALIKAADHAMYSAKRTGGNGVSLRPARELMESGIVETPTGRLRMLERRRSDGR